MFGCLPKLCSVCLWATLFRLLLPLLTIPVVVLLSALAAVMGGAFRLCRRLLQVLCVIWLLRLGRAGECRRPLLSFARAVLHLTAPPRLFGLGGEWVGVECL